MSAINIKRAVENIRSGTTVYTPAIELIVNAIEAVREKRSTGGLITVSVLRDHQEVLEGDDRLRAVVGFRVDDDGIGFDQRNRDSFDELYTDRKAPAGGKGFGRFTCLKYFTTFRVDSTFQEAGRLRRRQFTMGTDTDIITEEEVTDAAGPSTGSSIAIEGIKSIRFPDKGLEIIARSLLEKLLPYFIDPAFECPRIVVEDGAQPNKVVLNDYLTSDRRQIVELPVQDGLIELPGAGVAEEFKVRLFKFYAPRAPRSRVSLVAHRREVTETLLERYVPEFADEFYGAGAPGDVDRELNFIIKAYVFGDYLDRNVSVERGGFSFGQDADLLHPISQRQIERAAAEVAGTSVGEDIATRRERKQERIQDYIETQAPWHRGIVAETDFSSLPMRPSNDEIEMHLQRAKLDRESRTRAAVNKLLEDGSNETDLGQTVAELVKAISDTSKNDLAHYVSMRRCVLDLFERALEKDENGKYRSEGDVHDIIIPRRRDSDELDYEDHNLWILDERLNFTAYLSSDKAMGGDNPSRVDLAVFNRPIAFRGDNDPSNPIIIFEFKKPGRDEFTNSSSKEDPIEQIIRYVNDIREGRYQTPKGRQIRVTDDTPFYGYVVCDPTTKVRDWLYKVKNYTPLPDGLGWFNFHPNIRLYVEVLSWDKLLKDATMRNQVFFRQLGLT